MRTQPPLTDIDLRLLRVFHTIVECEGFTPAEVELNISRAAISQHMADLEKRLGLRLCRRGRAGFQLTDQGRAVHEAVGRLLAATENFRAEVNSAHSRLRGELTIGITDNLVTSPRMRVTNALRDLKRQAPDIHVKIRMSPPAEIEKGVLDGRLNVGVAPAGRVMSGLEEFPLYDEESCLYCAEDHPLFKVPAGELTREMVADADAVASGPGAGPLRITATAADREGVAFLILTGCYIGYLPSHYAKQWVDRQAMRALLPGDYVQTREYRAITLRGRHPNLVLETFLTLLHREEG